MYNSVVLTTFMMLCTHHHYLFPEVFCTPNKTVYTLSNSSSFFNPRTTVLQGNAKGFAFLIPPKSLMIDKIWETGRGCEVLIQASLNN